MYTRSFKRIAPLVLLGVLLLLSTLSVAVKSETNAFSYCLKESKNNGVTECLGKQAIYFLQEVQDSDNFTLSTGLVTEKNENLAARSVASLIDQDPVDFRGIFENAGAIFSQRNLQWDLSNLYPGLCLRIGPSADLNSVVEFALDPTQIIDERNYIGAEPSTARILTQRLILPLLLGLKFNLVTIVPLIFGAIILLCKKAALLAKFAIFLSGIFGVGGAFSLGSLANGNGFANGFSQGGHGHFRPGTGFLGSFGDPVHHHDAGYYRAERNYNFNKPRGYTESTPVPDKFYDFEKNVLLHSSNFKLSNHDEEEQIDDSTAAHLQSYRNFAWKTV